MRPARVDLFVVYDHPLDHPGDVVVRRWTVDACGVTAGEIVARGNTVEQARAVLSHVPGLARFEPDVYDDPRIAEVWR